MPAKKKKILVTSALVYANGPLHVGHLVEYIQTDIFVRFLKLTGEDVIYCCADDTHGTPVEIKAKEEGVAPEELIAKYYLEHTRDFKKYYISFDSYHSTNSEENRIFTELIFSRLREKGLIYQKDVEQAYCKKCKRYLPDRYVKGKCPKCGAEDQYGDVCEKCNATYTTTDLTEPYCTICRSSPERKVSRHYFFRLSACSKKIEKWLVNNRNLQPEIRNYVLNWIKEGLQDWDITRDGPYFGFKIPGEEDKYFYVWLDAPIGYIASTENYCRNHNLDAMKDYWQSDSSRIIHFIGKDIPYFHFLYWPAMLMESDINLPDDIVVHGFLTVAGEKMSKSRGTFYTAEEFAGKYEPELLRFFYASNLSRKLADINLDFKEFTCKTNSELVANLGNFCYRVLSFCNNNLDSKFGSIDESSIIKEIEGRFGRIKKAYSALNFREAVREIMAVSAIGNKYFQDNEPWKKIKGDRESAEKVIGTCVNIAKNLAILTKPILPRFSGEIEKQIRAEGSEWKDLGFDLRSHRIGKASIIIRKIEEKIEKKVFPLNLKVARIIEAVPHPDADKLMVIQADIGTEKRQVVAGIKEFYGSDELKGKNIVIVTNLKPARLRGYESRGMLLAAGEISRLLEAPASKPGDQVFLEGYENNKEQVTIDDFAKVRMKVRGKKVECLGRFLKTGSGGVKVDAEDGSKVR